MKVLLVRPLLLNMLAITGAIDCEPLELEYLYTACREMGVEAVLYDGITETRPFSAVLERERPEVVAITGTITPVTFAIFLPPPKMHRAKSSAVTAPITMGTGPA